MRCHGGAKPRSIRSTPLAFFPARPKKRKRGHSRHTGTSLAPQKDGHSFGNGRLLGTSALKDSFFCERKGVGLPMGRRSNQRRLARGDAACADIGRPPRETPAPPLTTARAYPRPSILVVQWPVAQPCPRIPQERTIRCRVLKRQFSLCSFAHRTSLFFYHTTPQPIIAPIARSPI